MSTRQFLASTAASALCISGATAFSQSVQGAEEGDWISVSGTVNAVEEDSFTLDYGTNTVEVEFDSLFAEIDADEKLRAGETVTVYGYADNDWFEGRVIDAEQVFVEDRYTYYGASSTPAYVVSYAQPYASTSLDGTSVSIEGEVQRVRNRMVTIIHNGTRIKVDTSEMTYNPVDDSGIQQVRKGDRIAVSGTLEDELFDDMTLVADRLYTLRSTSTDTRMASADNEQADAATAKSTKTVNSTKTNDAATKMAKADDQAEKDQKTEQRQASAEEMTTSSSASKTETASSDEAAAAAGEEFAMIDTNSNGYISEDEWVEYVSDPENITASQAREMFSSLARDDDRVTREEFLTPSERIDEMFENARNESE